MMLMMMVMCLPSHFPSMLTDRLDTTNTGPQILSTVVPPTPQTRSTRRCPSPSGHDDDYADEDCDGDDDDDGDGDDDGDDGDVGEGHDGNDMMAMMMVITTVMMMIMIIIKRKLV